MRHDHVPRHSLPCRRAAFFCFALSFVGNERVLAVLHLQDFPKEGPLAMSTCTCNNTHLSRDGGTCGLWSVL